MNGHERISESFEVLDTINYSFEASLLFSELYLYSKVFLRLFICKPIDVSKLLFSSRRKSVVHALIIYAKIQSERPQGHNIQPDIIRTHFLGKASIVALFFKWDTGLPFSVVCHGSDLYDSPVAFNLILENALHIDCVTYFGKGFVYGRLGKSAIGKVNLKRNKVSELFTCGFGNHDRDPTETLTIVFIGRLVTQKGVDFSLDVINSIRKRNQNIQYRIIGDGPLKLNLENNTRDLNLEEQVVFLGAMGSEEVKTEISKADCLLLPSTDDSLTHADGLPVVFQESLLLGVPVYCRDAFGIDEFIVQGFNGRSFNRNQNADVWAGRIIADMQSVDRNEIMSLAKLQFS